MQDILSTSNAFVVYMHNIRLLTFLWTKSFPWPARFVPYCTAIFAMGSFMYCCPMKPGSGAPGAPYPPLGGKPGKIHKIQMLNAAN